MVTSYSNSASFLTLFAPSNRANTLQCSAQGSTFNTSFGGTSAACPYAAGAAAALQSAAKSILGRYLSPAEVKSQLVSTGASVTDGKVAVTKPRVNLQAAIQSLGGSGSGGGVNLMILDIPAFISGSSGGGGFNEQFTGALGNWTQYSGTWTIGGGYASVAGSSSATWATMGYKNGVFSNLDYSVRMRRTISQYSANAIYIRGVPTPLDASNTWYSGYYFSFTNNGSYQVDYHSNGGVFTSFTGWVPSADIKPYDWNILRIRASGTTLTFFLNGTQVYQVSDSTFSSGVAGFGRYDGTGGTLDVDYATLSTISEAASGASPKAAVPLKGIDDRQSP